MICIKSISEKADQIVLSRHILLQKRNIFVEYQSSTINKMGLFDRLTGGASDAPLNKQEAFAAIMLAIIAADGDISDEEVEDFGARVNRMKLFNNMSGRQFPDMINKLFRILKKSGVSELINKAV